MPNSLITLRQQAVRPLKFKRAILPLLLLILIAVPQLRPIIAQSMADAFLQVTVFVAATLFLYYYLVERFPLLELSYVRQHFPKWEVPLAAFLGALPGCGGAIIVVTQFTKRQASFGSVVAVLTATMGDAAFLLLATRPLDGAIILSSGLVIGSVCGYIVNKIHHPDYLAPSVSNESKSTPIEDSCNKRIGRLFWRVAFIPSLIIGLLLAFQTNFSAIDSSLGQSINLFGAISAFIVISLWAFSSKGENYQEFTSEDDNSVPYSRFNKVMKDTHFVTAWVVAAFVLYEIAIHIFGLDLKEWFSHYAAFAPLAGLLIGLLPGCGPQILVTTLYIQGIVPFSALIANAISNDGDALFPAIALAPKAALVATLYSAIPALVIGYSVYFYLASLE